MAAAPMGSWSADGATTFHFDMPQPIPSYLFALAVGEITSRDLGPARRVYAEPDLIEAAAWEFAQIEDMLAEAEKLYGPYPWERYDMLVLPPSFPYGGMENARLTFLTPTMIVGDRSLTNLLAHELAHSWTGNLVTNATWEDFWLNEGWTTYAERRILGVIEGEDSAMLRAATGRNTMRRAIQHFGWDADPTPAQVLAGRDRPRVRSSPMSLTRRGTRSWSAWSGSSGDGPSTLSRGSTSPSTASRRSPPRPSSPSCDATCRKSSARSMSRTGLYAPGFPADAPPFESPLIDEVSNRLFDYQEGRLPRRADVAGWKTAQTYLFLQCLPRVIPVDDCRALESAFALDRTRVPQFLSQFFEIAIRSGYRQCSAAGRGPDHHRRPHVHHRAGLPGDGADGMVAPAGQAAAGEGPPAPSPDHRAGDGADAHPARAVTWRRPTKRRLTASKTCRTISPIPTVGISAQ